MPSRINGGRASLRQEVDFDSLYICPQKMGHALTAGPAIDRWDWRRILGNVARFSRLPDIPKLADRNGFRNLDRKYGLNVCVMTVQSSIQPLGSGLETSSYPQLESHGGTSNPDDRQIGRYDDSDWSREKPNQGVRKGSLPNGDDVRGMLSIYKGDLAQRLGSHQPASSGAYCVQISPQTGHT